MLVFGDLERSETAAAVSGRVSARLAKCRQLPSGLERHTDLVAAFVDASTLVQAIADRERDQLGVDELSSAQEAGAGLLLSLAEAIAASWNSNFAEFPAIDESGLGTLSLPEQIRTKLPEGYAFYALYPESYLEAARRSGLGPDTTVLGIRSIGIGLAAMVAAALGAAPAISVRPVGHPFDRRIDVGQGLRVRILSSAGAIAIVDEGPGLSGSSFNGVADWLVENAVSEDRIHFFPSHAGELGSQAQLAHRTRWAKARKHVVEFDQLLLQSGRLEHWITHTVGPLTAPLHDLSGGAWRSLTLSSPPADPAMEKRKFLVEAKSGKYLAKFVGLGDSGEHKRLLAQTLSHAGFAPAPAGLCHGFLLTDWIEPVPTPNSAPPRERVLDYLALRARLPPTGAGASLRELFDMARYNIGQSLGPEWGESAKLALGDPSRFAAQPCCTDNRMHAWEWLHGPEGWIKLDGLDHHAAHDLVGCQDIAWDLAGATVELDLPVTDLGPALYALLGRNDDPSFIAAMQLCYLGFQIGLWTMAADRNGYDEKPAIQRQIDRYTRRVRAMLT